MIKFKTFLIERIHTSQNDSKLMPLDKANSLSNRSYKIVNQSGVVILTTIGIGNNKYLHRKELVTALRRIVYTSEFDVKGNKKWTFQINNKPVAYGAPKDLIEFLSSAPLREEVEDEEEPVEREEKPKLFLVIDKESDRKYSSHRSKVDAEKAIAAMDDEDRKKYKIQIEEAAYAGNVGFAELAVFYQSSSVKEKGELDKLIRTGKHKEAWALVMKVTKTRLVGMS